ncbi:MAG: histidine kinase [Spirosomataceae bacterium]
MNFRFLRILIIIFLYLGFSNDGFSQINVSNLSEIGKIDLSDSTEIYIDSSAKLNFEAIQNQQFKTLKSISFPTIAIQNYENHYWLRFKLKNSSDQTQKLLFSAGLHLEISLFDGESVLSASQKYRKPERPYIYDYRYLPIEIGANQTKEYYVLITDLIEKKFELKPVLMTESYDNAQKMAAFYSDSYTLSVNYGLITILFFMGLFIFMQYWLNRQRYFLYYSYYLFSMWLFSIWGFSHATFVSNLMNYVPFLKFTLRQNFYVLVAHYFYFLFVAEFLETHIYNPRIDKYFKILRKSILFLVVLEVVLTVIYRRLDFEIYLTFFSQLYLSVNGLIAIVLIFTIKGQFATFIKIGSLSLLFASIFGFLSIYLDLVPQSSAILPHYPNIYFNYFVLGEILCFSLGLGYKFSESIREKSRLQQEISQSELNVLRLQINPHFIFNSLNSIKSYILKEKSNEAANYLSDFSQLFRAVLEQSREPIITLKEEIDTLLLYIKLEQKRLQEQFEFDFIIEPEINTQDIILPSLLLQPYVENAIKHGLSSKKTGGILNLSFSINKDVVICRIEDNGVGRMTAYGSSKEPSHRSMGTQIINERLKLFKESYNWDIRVEIIDKYDSGVPTGTLISIEIPVQ